MKEIKKYAEVVAKVKDDLFDYNKIKENIYIRLYGDVNVEFPHTTVSESDLVAVCYVNLSNTETETTDSMTENVSEAMLKSWGVSFETVLKDARINMLRECDYHSMYEIMKDMMDDMVNAGMSTIDEAEIMFAEMRYNPMRILTKKDKVFGAGMLAVPEALDKVFGTKKRLILPSSVHEGATRFAA